MAANLKVAEELVGGMLIKAEDASKIPENGAAIAKIGGEKAAAYRDESGIHAVSPACTHLGCHVNWNNAERTWDCPCHGSRYTVDGEVIHSPTVINLRQIEKK
jgi:Rieske Fe-S protein